MAGRPKGTRQWSDESVLLKMAVLVATGEAHDHRAAARQLQREAAGPAGPDSKVRRLIRQYEAEESRLRNEAKRYLDARADLLRGERLNLDGIGAVLPWVDSPAAALRYIGDIGSGDPIEAAERLRRVLEEEARELDRINVLRHGN